MIKNKFIKFLQSFDEGYLTITTPSGELIDVGSKNDDLKADIQIHDWFAVKAILLKGNIGFAQMYMKSLITTTDIVSLLLVIGKNADKIDKIARGNFCYSLIFRLKNIFRKNTHRGSKKNIEYHYDLGNDFYKLWLDTTMTYSSGYFKDGSESLPEAQHNKYSLILENLSNIGKDILEIGSGWGGFINEAEKQGYNVRGLTLSSEQKQYVDNLIQKNHWHSKVVLEDYRTEGKKFSNIVSIEMFEAVGREYWEVYFQKIKQCLKQKGRAIIQTIVIDDDRYESYNKTSDFIREYIFPGGFLPSNKIFQDLVKNHNLQIIYQQSFGQSYQKTLLIWLQNFKKIEMEIHKLGYDRQFTRMWELYLAYCATGFAIKRTDVIQYTLEHA